ncbi:MAG: glycosyltransferase [Oculatellaceae cyanobacterium Prado106]|jgi:hypothetical protein|nr:glycosyltransferase [Oculatellaceae cyanobacterium Prado106]
MNLFVLSESSDDKNHVSNAVGQTLEDVIASTCNATFIYPFKNDRIELLNGLQFSDAPYLRRFRHRIFKSWYTLDSLPQLGKNQNILLIIGMQPFGLLAMHALKDQLNQFDLKIGYILDGFNPNELDRSLIGNLDHLFVISAELADHMNDLGYVPTHFLPIATDVSRYGSLNPHRWIDIISYGRTNPQVHRTLQQHFYSPNQPNCKRNRVYYRSTFARGDADNLQDHISILSRLLSCSKVSLCFEASHTPRFMGYSPLLYRWFEGWAAGCTLVGKKPFGKGTADLMDWENSTINLPDSSTEWIPFLEELLKDSEWLSLNAQRNYRESLLRHDWRYRLQDLFKIVELPVPETLKLEITALTNQAQSLSIPSRAKMSSMGSVA